MTVKFYSEDGIEGLEIIPNPEKQCVYIEFVNVHGLSSGSITLNDDAIDDFIKTLKDFKERIL